MENVYESFPFITATVAFIVAVLTSVLLGQKCKNMKLDSPFAVIVVNIILLITVLGFLLGTFMKTIFEIIDEYAETQDNSNYVEESIDDKDDKIYSEIEIILANGYTVYVNGSKVDIDDFCISDYPSDSYYINNDRKEIYIKEEK